MIAALSSWFIADLFICSFVSVYICLHLPEARDNCAQIYRVSRCPKRSYGTTGGGTETYSFEVILELRLEV